MLTKGLLVVAEPGGFYDWAVPRTLGENLRRLRTLKGLTQEQLAEKLGHSRGKNSTVSKWERDPDWLPSRSTITRLCEILEHAPWELFEDVITPYDKLRQKPEFDVEEEARRIEREEARRKKRTR